MSEQKSVLFVCLGNICRSPIAAAVFRHIVKLEKVENQWKCDSAAIEKWHNGKPMDSRSAEVLSEYGIDTNHTARQITTSDFTTYDYIFGMDQDNIEALKRKAPANCKAKIELLVKYDPGGSSIIRDPYHDEDLSGFKECYHISLRACKAFLAKQ